MSKDIDRKQVLQNIRVRNAPKTDDWWIQRSKDDKVISKVKQEPAPAIKVPSRSKRFQLPSPSEQAQKQLPVINTNKENKEVEVKAPAGKSNVEQNMATVKVSADVNKEEQIQPASSANDKIDRAEPLPANKTVDVKEKNTDTDPTNVDYQVSSDLQVKASATGTVEVPATPQEEALIKTEPENTSSLKDAGEKISVQATKGSQEQSLQPAEEIVPAASPFIVKEFSEDISPQASVESNIQCEPVIKSPAQPGNETPAEASCEKHPPEEDDNDTVEALVEPELETPDVDNATPSEEAPALNSVQPITYTLPESHAEIQSVENTAVQQNVEPSFEDAIHPTNLNIEDALELIPAADPEAVQDSSDYRLINLTDVLDVEAPPKKSVPKTEEREQPHQEEPNPQADDSKVSAGLQKPADKPNSTQVLNISSNGKPICSYCNKVIDGNVKITLNEPPVVCHPECLKCGVCAKALEDMLTCMFLHDKVIHCGDCFARALNI